MLLISEHLKYVEDLKYKDLFFIFDIDGAESNWGVKIFKHHNNISYFSPPTISSIQDIIKSFDLIEESYFNRPIVEGDQIEVNLEYYPPSFATSNLLFMHRKTLVYPVVYIKE